ncbi:aldehyde dehydrogenase family protein [Rhizobium skierniewicense]|nr:aldehyde dehydrogenase family protein [Rhizobium skierniewicense]
MLIDGKWLSASNGATFDDLNPVDGSLVARIADATAEDLDAAIVAAKVAQPAWEAMAPFAKSALFLNAARIFEERKNEFAQALIAETGSSFGKAMFECSVVPTALLEAAALPTREIGEIYASQTPGKINRVVRRAAGVVGAISPWNFPLYLSLRAFMHAVALGNTAVLKPSEDSPLTGGLLIGKLFADAGFPAGVLNVVTTSRDGAAMVGDTFVNDPRINVLSFTGSTHVGKMLSTGCAAVFKPIMLELGGKNASIVLDDADVDRAVDLNFFGAFMHQGQICMSTDRILVHRSLYDTFVRKFVAKTAQFQPTAPNEMHCVIGPIINTRQLRRIERMVGEAVAAGAVIETGGKAEDPYFQPTVLTAVSPNMAAWREEFFGPVTTITPFDTDEQAISLANDSAYGLTGSIITSDVTRGEMLAERFAAGMIHVNDSTVHEDAHCPFSGHGASGGGGKWGPRGAIEAFTVQRWISTQREPHPLPF